MLSKQSIRKTHTIFYNGELVEKDVIIELSKDFSEIEAKGRKQGFQAKISMQKSCVARFFQIHQFINKQTTNKQQLSNN